MALLIAIGVLVAWLVWGKHGRARQGSGAALAPTEPFDASASPLAAYGAGPSGLDYLSQAIFQREGGQPGDINFDNFNPGDLRSAPGQLGTNRGYATFGSFTDGFQALRNYISGTAGAHPEWDFYDFFQHYLGQQQGGPTVTDQGDSDSYAEYVAHYAGVDPTTRVSDYLAGAS